MLDTYHSKHKQATTEISKTQIVTPGVSGSFGFEATGTIAGGLQWIHNNKCKTQRIKCIAADFINFKILWHCQVFSMCTVLSLVLCHGQDLVTVI